MIKANFKLTKTSKYDSEKKSEETSEPHKDLTQSEFEDFIIKSGASGSFMVFRSDKKTDELGIEEL